VPGRLLHGLGHRTWRYGLYAPGGLNDDISAPLIVVLHGCKQRALSFAYAAGWTDFADSAHVRLLYPDQRRLANFYRRWNWFHPLAQSGQGELSVITAMIDDAAGRVRIHECSEAGRVSRIVGVRGSWLDLGHGIRLAVSLSRKPPAQPGVTRATSVCEAPDRHADTRSLLL
jgi:hypothetical protein